MKSICLQDWEIRALQEGRKKQFRVLVKPQPNNVQEPEEGFINCYPDGTVTGRQRYLRQSMSGESDIDVEEMAFATNDNIIKSPFGGPGDKVFVKETWWAEDYNNHTKLGSNYVCYKAEGLPGDKAWRSSVTMPEWASRFTLLIKSVRVERVNEISEEDARAEGIERDFAHGKDIGWKNYLWHGHHGQYGNGNKKTDAWPYQYSTYNEDAIGSFSSSWQLRHPGSWERGDWVFVAEVERE